MKIAAGCIALLVAIILLGGAFVDFIDDVKNKPERIRAYYAAIERHDDAAVDRDNAEAESRQNSMAVRAVAGAAFLVAGLFILGKREKVTPAAS
ncbi:MAG: hypothetical protein ACLQU1_36805 [Bryobacteraceae bacterium]